MSGEERRAKLVEIIRNSAAPVSGTALALELNVSRQVIVQDIALVRTGGVDIISTHKGYIIQEPKEASRVFKVIHSDEEVADELNLIVDLGGRVKDVFVYHKVYDVVRAEMNIKSRRDVKRYLDDIASGKSVFLKNVTSGYHYHTVIADSEQTLDMIQKELEEKGFLAKLQEHEPVDFWKK